jgi:hypothetical protein
VIFQRTAWIFGFELDIDIDALVGSDFDTEFDDRRLSDRIEDTIVQPHAFRGVGSEATLHDMMRI